MTLVFGMKLASATPILLTFDWTGQCDDCQGPNGAIDVPGTNLDDGYTQDVSGLLKVNYDPDIDPIDGFQFKFVSFVYYGSSILYQSNSLESGTFLQKDVFSIIGSSVFVTGHLRIAMDKFRYKGNYADLAVGSQFAHDSRRGIIWSQVTQQRYYFTKGWYTRPNTFFLSYEFDTIVIDTPRSDPPIGSRDEGYDSKYIMRGSLPPSYVDSTKISEPSMIAIFALGVLGLSLRRKKRA
jgi:hypothetical protein